MGGGARRSETVTGEPLIVFEKVAAGYRAPVVGPASFAVLAW